MTGLYLAIDTSTRYGAVGLWSAGALVRVYSWYSRHNHTSELMPAVEAAMDAAGARMADVAGVAVARGPGGFSALRSGLGAAKGLACLGDVVFDGDGYTGQAARVLPVGHSLVDGSGSLECVLPLYMCECTKSARLLGPLECSGYHIDRTPVSHAHRTGNDQRFHQLAPLMAGTTTAPFCVAAASSMRTVAAFT